MIFFIKAAVTGLITLALICGCSVLPERSAKQTFLLPPPTIASNSQNEIPLTLRVNVPQAESPLNGTRILVNPEGHNIQAYNGARWGKATPLLVRDHWIEGLRQTGALKAVVIETSDAASDLSLSSDLILFQLYYPSDEPTVIIQVDAQLLERESGKVLATRRFRAQQPTSDKPVGAIIDSFGSASQAITESVAAWVIDVSRRYFQETDPATPL